MIDVFAELENLDASFTTAEDNREVKSPPGSPPAEVAPPPAATARSQTPPPNAAAKLVAKAKPKPSAASDFLEPKGLVPTSKMSQAATKRQMPSIRSSPPVQHSTQASKPAKAAAKVIADPSPQFAKLTRYRHHAAPKLVVNAGFQFLHVLKATKCRRHSLLQLHLAKEVRLRSHQSHLLYHHLKRC